MIFSIGNKREHKPCVNIVTAEMFDQPAAVRSCDMGGFTKTEEEWHKIRYVEYLRFNMLITTWNRFNTNPIVWSLSSISLSISVMPQWNRNKSENIPIVAINSRPSALL